MRGVSPEYGRATFRYLGDLGPRLGLGLIGVLGLSSQEKGSWLGFLTDSWVS